MEKDKLTKKEIDPSVFIKAAEELLRDTENIGLKEKSQESSDSKHFKDSKRIIKNPGLPEIKKEVETKVHIKPIKKSQENEQKFEKFNEISEIEKPRITVEVDIARTIEPEPIKKESGGYKVNLSELFHKHLPLKKEKEERKENRTDEAVKGLRIINLPEVIVHSPKFKILKPSKNPKDVFKNIESERLIKEIQDYKKSKDIPIEKPVFKNPIKPSLKKKSSLLPEVDFGDIKEDFKIDNLDYFSKSEDLGSAEQQKILEQPSISLTDSEISYDSQVEAEKIGQVIEAESIGQFIDAKAIGKEREIQKNASSLIEEYRFEEKSKSKPQRFENVKKTQRVTGRNYIEKQKFKALIFNLGEIQNIIIKNKKSFEEILDLDKNLEDKNIKKIDFSNDKMLKNVSSLKQDFLAEIKI